MSIVRDDEDRRRFVRTLFYLNDTHVDEYWHRSTAQLSDFERPQHWPERRPLVHVVAWTLVGNHFHLLVQEIQEGGLAKFMQRVGVSLTSVFNKKYHEKGSLFQGGYRGRTVGDPAHLDYLAFYILVKNVLDMYPSGLVAAQQHFDDAWEWAKRYPYSSFRDLVAGNPSPMIDDPDGLMNGIVGRGDAFREEARELLDFHMTVHGGDLSNMMLEPW